MALSSSAARGRNSKGVCVVWLKKSLKLAVEGEILATRLGPMVSLDLRLLSTSLRIYPAVFYAVFGGCNEFMIIEVLFRNPY